MCQAWWWDSSRDAIDAAAIAGKVWPGNCRGIYCILAAAYGAVSVSVFFFFTRDITRVICRDYRALANGCRAWRRASTRAETGTGTVGEAAAAIAAASIASRLLSHHHAWHTSRGSCRSCCLAYTIPVPVSARVLARLQARQLDLSICQGSSRDK